MSTVTNLLQQEKTNIASALVKLRKNAHVKISDLEGDLLEDFDRIRLYAKLLYEKPQYREFSDILARYFGNSGDYEMDTVGITLGGCLAGARKGFDSCSPECYNSLPLHNQKACDENMVMGIPTDDGIRFIINKKNKSAKARLYIPPGMNLSSAEKDYLLGNNIDDVEVCDYGNNVCIPSTHVMNLPTRQVEKIEIVTKTDNYVMLTVVIFASIILLSIIIISMLRR